MAYFGSIRKLAKVLKPLSDQQDANAAVALLLKIAGEDLEALLAKRVENSSDSWSGQMALPGGKRSPEDRNLCETVVKETFEETKINLHDRCRFLGVTETKKSALQPEMKALPFVFLLKYKPDVEINEGELEKFFWIPLKALVEHRSTVKFSFGEFPAFVVGNEVIWGLTYRILETLFRYIEYLS